MLFSLNFTGNTREIFFFFIKQIVEIQLFMLNSDVFQPSHVGKLDRHKYEYRKGVRRKLNNEKLNDWFNSNCA